MCDMTFSSWMTGWTRLRISILILQLCILSFHSLLWAKSDAQTTRLDTEFKKRNEQKSSLTIRVREAGSQVKIIGASFVLKALTDTKMVFEFPEVESDIKGFAVYENLEAGEYKLEAAMPGYEREVFVLTLGLERVTADIALKPKRTERFQTTTRARRGGEVTSRIELSREEIRDLAGTMGDSLRVLESLPGVARTPFIGSAILVRGGMPNETQVYFDGVPIPILYHFGGIRSVLNSEVVEGIDFYQGGMPAPYGHALAGTVNVRLREPELDAYRGRFEMDLFNAGFFLSGSVGEWKGWKTGFAIAARRSYFDFPVTLGLNIASMAGANTSEVTLPLPSFSDYFARVHARHAKGHHLSLSLLGSDDSWAVIGNDEEIQSLDEDGYQNLGEVLNQGFSSKFWRIIADARLNLNPGLTLRVTPWAGQTTKGLLSDGLVTQAFTGSPLAPPESRNEFGMRATLNWDIRHWLKLNLGSELRFDTRRVWSGNTLFGEDFSDAFVNCPVEAFLEGRCSGRIFLSYDFDVKNLSFAPYAEVMADLGRLKLRLGLRAGLNSLSFENRVDWGVLAEDTDLNVGRVRTTNLSWDPRLDISYALSPKYKLKYALGVYHQNHDLRERVLQRSAERLRPMFALHSIMGFEATPIDALTLDVQAYRVQRFHLTTMESLSINTLDELGVPAGLALPEPGLRRQLGYGTTHGFETMLRVKPRDYFFGWLSYTFGRSTRNLYDARDPAAPSAFDSRHNLVLMSKFLLPRGWSIGARFQVASGAPSPAYQNYSIIQDSARGRYQSTTNTLRLPRNPTFHRLDFRVDKTWVRRFTRITLYLDLVNVYHHFNSEIVIPGIDYRGRTQQTLVPSLPILPMLGLKGGF